MPANRSLKVGLVGTGFMGRTHSNAYHQVRRFFPQEGSAELVAVCSRDATKAREFAAQWGFGSYEADWRKLVARNDVDLIDIASPNDTHAEIALAAAAAGKMVACEKPLGRELAEARRMVEAVERADVANMVWYNYRRVPGTGPCQGDGRRRQARPHLSQPFQVSPRLDHVGGTAPRRYGHVAAGRCRVRQRSHRRPACALHRCSALAGRADCRGVQCDGGVHPRAHACRERETASGHGRGRQPLSCAVHQPLACDFRGDPVRARPQGAVHGGSERRARLDILGPARPAQAPVLRPP